MDKRCRISEIFKAMVQDNEDEIIWSLSRNRDIIHEEFGFEVLNEGNMCICGHMFEKLRHNDHVFHIDKLADWIISGRCPHSTSETRFKKQVAKTTFLHCACALGKIRVIKFLVHEHNVSLESTTKATLFAPIHFAIYNKNIELFHYLISKKVDINRCCRGLDRYSPLMLAVIEKSTHLVEKILNHENVQKNFVNSVQKGALCCAVENDDYKMVEILVSGGVLATPPTIKRAEAMGNEQILELVLSTRDLEFFTPRQQHESVYNAIIKGQVSFLRIYLEKGFSLRATTEFDSPVEENPLFHAALRNEVEMVRLLIQYKVDVCTKIGGNTCLDIARLLDLHDIIEILQNEYKRKKLPLNLKECAVPTPFQTLLVLSLPNSILFSSISAILSKGFDINEYDSCGFTPLINSILKDNTELVKFLIKKGADPNRQVPQPVCMTPLQAAVIKANLSIVKILLLENVKMEVLRPIHVLYGSDTYNTLWITNPVDMPRQRSALCDAVCRSHVHIAILLLRCGYDLAVEDIQTARWMIKHTKSNHVRQYLIDHMTKPRRLSIICRNYIRQRHRNNIHKFVVVQDIPVTLKSLLLLHDIIR